VNPAGYEYGSDSGLPFTGLDVRWIVALGLIWRIRQTQYSELGVTTVVG
jgi:hypothetical protein